MKPLYEVKELAADIVEILDAEIAHIYSRRFSPPILINDPYWERALEILSRVDQYLFAFARKTDALRYSSALVEDVIEMLKAERAQCSPTKPSMPTLMRDPRVDKVNAILRCVDTYMMREEEEAVCTLCRKMVINMMNEL